MIPAGIAKKIQHIPQNYSPSRPTINWDSPQILTKLPAEPLENLTGIYQADSSLIIIEITYKVLQNNCFLLSDEAIPLNIEVFCKDQPTHQDRPNLHGQFRPGNVTEWRTLQKNCLTSNFIMSPER
jgi:hypothetical protein